MRPQPNSTWIAGMKTQPRPCWQKLIPTWSDQTRTGFMPTQLSLTLQCTTPPTQPRDTVWTNSHLLWGIRKRMDPCTDGPTRKWTYMHNLYLFSSDWVGGIVGFLSARSGLGFHSCNSGWVGLWSHINRSGYVGSLQARLVYIWWVRSACCVHQS